MTFTDLASNYLNISWIIILLFYSLLLLLRRWSDRLSLIVVSLQYILFTTLFFFIINWHLDYFLRYTIVIICAVVVFFTLKKAKKLPMSIKQKTPKRILSFVPLLLIIILNTLAIGAYYHDKDIIELQFPFKNGTYCINNGGNTQTSLFMNSHTTFFYNNPTNYALGKGNAFAVDVVKLNDFGTSAIGVLQKDLNKHEIYGETIYSPCDGTVVFARDYYDDIVSTTQSATATETNIVCIESGDFHVLMVHLKKDSIKVEVNDIVKKGQPLAETGNSGMGNHVFPHLHISVQKNVIAGMSGIRYGHGVPFLFNGKFPVKNELYIVKD